MEELELEAAFGVADVEAELDEDEAFGISPGSKDGKDGAVAVLTFAVFAAEDETPFCVDAFDVEAFELDGVFAAANVVALNAVKVALKSTLYFGFFRIYASRFLRVGALTPETVCFVSGLCMQIIESKKGLINLHILFSLKHTWIKTL